MTYSRRSTSIEDSAVARPGSTHAEINPILGHWKAKTSWTVVTITLRATSSLGPLVVLR